MHLAARAVTGAAGEPVPLTAAEFNLLAHLLEAEGAAVLRQLLFERVLRRPFRAEDRNIDQLVFPLQRKLAAASCGTVFVLAERGLGYRVAHATPDEPDATASGRHPPCLTIPDALPDDALLYSRLRDNTGAITRRGN